MRKIGEECGGAIDLVEYRVGERRHARNIDGVTISLEVAISRIDVSIRVYGANGPVERPLYGPATYRVLRIALP
jgi:hypothetical protein